MFLPHHLSVSSTATTACQDDPGERLIVSKGDYMLYEGREALHMKTRRAQSRTDDVRRSSSLRSSRTVGDSDAPSSPPSTRTNSLRGRRSTISLVSHSPENKKKPSPSNEDDNGTVAKTASGKTKSTSSSKKKKSSKKEKTGLDAASTHSSKSSRKENILRSKSSFDSAVLSSLSQSTTLPKEESTPKLKIRRTKSDAEASAKGRSKKSGTSTTSIPVDTSPFKNQRSTRRSMVSVQPVQDTSGDDPAPTMDIAQKASQRLRNGILSSSLTDSSDHGPIICSAQKASQRFRNSTNTNTLSQKSLSPKTKRSPTRSNTFDATISLERESSKRSTRTSAQLPENPPRTAAGHKEMLLKSSAKEKATRKIRHVHFCGDTSNRVHSYEDTKELNKCWYAQADLKMLLDHELTCIVRSRGTARGLHFCKRGVEHLLAGEDKSAKIRDYVRKVRKAAAEIQQKRAGDDSTSSFSSAAKQLRVYSQTLTKEDRKNGYRFGFFDASEVQVMKVQNDASEAQSSRQRETKTVLKDVNAFGESVRLLMGVPGLM